MSVPLVRKIGPVKEYLKVHPRHSRREGTKVKDIGGICEYYDLLRSAVSPSELYVLNIERHSVRGCQSIVANALELPFCDGT